MDLHLLLFPENKERVTRTRQCASIFDCFSLEFLNHLFFVYPFSLAVETDTLYVK